MTTRVAVVADSHFDERSRFDECIRIHDWLAARLAETGVDLVVHTGDVYERKSTPREREAVASWVQRVAECAPVVIVRGNHDAIGDLPLLERLESRHPIRVVETCGVATVGPVAVACLGWPQRSNVHSMLQGGSEFTEQAAVAALKQVLAGLGQQLAEHSGPRILAAHAMVRASRASTGQPLVGCDFELGLEDLALAQAGFYALGHIHLGQDWEIAGAPCVYPGSPRRTAFGESESKGFLLVEFDGNAVRWERVETPCTPMVHLEAIWDGEAFTGGTTLPEAERHGAEVRFRYRCRSDRRAAAKAAAAGVADELRELGAVSVKVEEVLEVEQRSRAPEVAAATTLRDKLGAYWRAKDFEPGDRREALLSKLNTVETEALHAA